MILNDKIRERYTKEQFSARQAQELALLYSWSPAVFQIARLMVDWGVLDAIDNSKDGLTVDEVMRITKRNRLSVCCLLEASLTSSILLVNPETDKYRLSKIGWFLLHDEMTRVNLRFNQAVNYRSFYHLDESLMQEKPVGLKTLGMWNSIYEALCYLPYEVRNAWLDYDHFYSNNSYEVAIPYVLDNSPHTLLDVGGNTGEMALRCVSIDKNIKVTVCDLPQQIEMMYQAIAGKEGAERIDGFAVNLLDEEVNFSQQYDVIWMSQFIMCFSEEQIDDILHCIIRAMHKNSVLYMMEVMWNQQQYPAAAFCQTMNSLYFVSTASGNNKMLSFDTLIAHIEKVGLRVMERHDQIGIGGHTLLKLRKIIK